MAHHDVLLLNANYEPLNVCNLRRAVTLLVLGKAEIIQDTENIVLTSSGTLIVPTSFACATKSSDRCLNYAFRDTQFLQETSTRANTADQPAI